jgi:imidazolonepropionase-like amidohydrolase
MKLSRQSRVSLLIIAAVVSPSTAAPLPRRLAITHVNVVDVVSGRVLPNSTVVIDGGTIASVTQNPPPGGARVFEGQGKFLIPGLWDMHAHMEAAGQSALELYVANGVTGVRDMGSTLDFILKLREATASGRVLGPRIFAAGPILDDAPGDWPFRMRVKTSVDGRAAVQLLKRRGVDLIKVHDHTPGAAFFAIVEEARRQNLPLAGHVPMGLTVQQVVDAGQGDIEHLDNLRLWAPCPGPGYPGPEACKALFEMLARRGVWQGPTLAAMSELATIGTPASQVSEDQLAYVSKTLKSMWAGNQSLFATPEVIRQLRSGAAVGAVVTSDMAKAGVGILAGCDSMVPGFCVHDEIVAMVRGGMAPLTALQTATLNPAKYFHMESAFGSVDSGKRADLVLLDANPLVDISNVRAVRAVVVSGRLLQRKDLDGLLVRVKTEASKP